MGFLFGLCKLQATNFVILRLMDRLNSLYIKLSERIARRFVTLAIIFLVGSVLLQFPNPVTHECVPNGRTILGLPSDGYPYNKYFCNEGYYPVLRFGLEDFYANAITQMFIVLILMGLVPAAYIIIASERKSRRLKK